jgi:hypothetical protein
MDEGKNTDPAQFLVLIPARRTFMHGVAEEKGCRRPPLQAAKLSRFIRALCPVNQKMVAGGGRDTAAGDTVLQEKRAGTGWQWYCAAREERRDGMAVGLVLGSAVLGIVGLV